MNNYTTKTVTHVFRCDSKIIKVTREERDYVARYEDGTVFYQAGFLVYVEKKLKKNHDTCTKLGIEIFFPA